MELDNPLPPQTRLGPYEIIDPIGVGGMGVVYRALDTRLGREVAIKVSSDRFSERFEREARAVAALNHPNICTLHDVGSNYLVMEYVEGDAPKGPLPLDEALRIAHQVADALEAAHDKGIIHRDLKPGNIRIKPDGTVKVLDFGLAKMINEPIPDSGDSPTISMAATQAGAILGTAGYMAPEQARGMSVDKRADIWAFGVLLYELITGRQLFRGDDVTETIAAVIRQETRLDDVPLKVRRLLQSCLEKDPRHRLRDIADAWKLLDDDPVLPPTTSNRPSWFLLAASILIVGIASALFFARWRTSQDPPLKILDIDLGADVALSPVPSEYTVILSPDGTRLLYSSGYMLPTRAALGGSVERGPLFIDRFDGSRPVELPGTARSTYAFFSADSKWIGFIASGKLNRISVEGGSVIPIADVPPGISNGIWTKDGSFIFGSTAGLWRIPPDNAKPVQIAEPAGESFSRVYQVLPGDKTVLAVSYAAISDQTMSVGSASIEAISLTDGSRKLISRAGVSPRYLPTGHLVYASRSTLFAAPFDLNRLAISGEAVPILNDLRFNTQTGFVDFSFADDGTAVYRKGTGVSLGEARAPTVLDLIEVGGKRTELIKTPRSYARPRLSPDGTQLALLITTAESREEWVYDLNRQASVPITFGGISITTPAWLPGRRLVFGGANAGIYWARSDGSIQPKLLREDKALLFVTSYSERLKKLAYFTGSSPARIFTVSLFDEDGQLKSGNPELFLDSPFSTQEPYFSDDGNWIAYASNESNRYEINVRPYPVTAQTGKVQVSTTGGVSPRWSSTTNEIVYRSGDQIIAVPYTTKDGVFIPGKARIRVEKLGGTEWDLAPDGGIVVVRTIEGSPQASPDHTVTYVQNFFDELRRRMSE